MTETGPEDLNARLDALIQQLIEADQRGSGIDLMQFAHELGELKVLVARRKTIRPRPGGEGHWRCERCGTITHAPTEPTACPECGATQLWPADRAQPDVEPGAG